MLVRRRADMDPIATALRARGLPVEVVGLGGLLDTPEVRDLVSALRLVADPLAGPAAVRLLTGARWRLGVADLAALWQRAREIVPAAAAAVRARAPPPSWRWARCPGSTPSRPGWSTRSTTRARRSATRRPASPGSGGWPASWAGCAPAARPR